MTSGVMLPDGRAFSGHHGSYQSSRCSGRLPEKPPRPKRTAAALMPCRRSRDGGPHLSRSIARLVLESTIAVKAEHEDANGRCQGPNSLLGIDHSDEIRQRHVAIACDLPQCVPKFILNGNARVAASDFNETSDSRSFHLVTTLKVTVPSQWIDDACHNVYVEAIDFFLLARFEFTCGGFYLPTNATNPVMALRWALTPFGEATLKTNRAYHLAFAGQRQPNGVQQDISALIVIVHRQEP